ncbi:hypothetical protein [Actinoplanes philippinensis]|nr:hypothetical protein [Actinoplanes philippinensis]
MSAPMRPAVDPGRDAGRETREFLGSGRQRTASRRMSIFCGH